MSISILNLTGATVRALDTGAWGTVKRISRLTGRITIVYSHRGNPRIVVEDLYDLAETHEVLTCYGWRLFDVLTDLDRSHKQIRRDTVAIREKLTAKAPLCLA